MICLIALAIISTLIATTKGYCPDEVKGGFKECNCYYIDHLSNDSTCQHLIQTCKYDSIGRLIFKTSDGSHGGIEIFKYDSIGNLTKKSKYRKRDTSIIKTEIFIYDSLNNLIETLEYDYNNELDVMYYHEYDSMCRLKIKYILSNIGNYACIYQYKYNSKSEMIEQIGYYSKHHTKWKLPFETDSIVSVFKTLPSNTINFRSIYIFDSLGNKIAAIHFENNKLIEKYIFKYNSINMIVEKRHSDSLNSMRSKEYYSYDSLGNKIEHIEYNYGKWPKISRRVFEYDSLGNISKVIWQENDEKPFTSRINIYSK